MFDAGRGGRPRTSEENIERVKQAFHRSSMSPSVLLPDNWNFHVQQCTKSYTRI